MSPQTRREYSFCFLALCEQAFCFLVCFGLNTVVFLPQTLRLGTHTLFSFSKYSRESSTLTHACQAGILLAWTRNQNIRQCGLLRKICKQLPVFGNCRGASLIRRLFDWLCKLWQGRSNPPTNHTPKGRPIHPPLKKTGLSGPFTVKCTSFRSWTVLRSRVPETLHGIAGNDFASILTLFRLERH